MQKDVRLLGRSYVLNCEGIGWLTVFSGVYRVKGFRDREYRIVGNSNRFRICDRQGYSGCCRCYFVEDSASGYDWRSS